MSTRFLPALLWALIPVSAQAQVCAPGGVYVSHDGLPQVPPALPAGVAVVPGLCEGEGIGAAYDVSGLGSSARIQTTSVGFFNNGGANGLQASVNLRIHDGITWNGVIPTLGPVVFDWAAQTGSSIALSSHGINTQDLSAFNVVVTSGTLVVTWIMEVNFNGNCAAGFQTNFGVDTGPAIQCATTPRQNLILIQGQGWRDPASAVVQGFPLCGLFYNGNWVMRSCVEGGSSFTTFCTPKAGLVCGTPSISASGTPSATATFGFTLSSAPARGNRLGVLMYNMSQGNPLPFNGGTLCVTPTGIRRGGPTSSLGTNGQCDGSFDIDMNTFAQGFWIVPPAGSIPSNNPAQFLKTPGTNVFAQFWGRDSVGSGSYISDGLQYAVGP